MTNDLIEVVFWSIIIFLVFKYFWYSESFNEIKEITGLKQTENLNAIVDHVTGTLDNDDLFYKDEKLSNFANDLERKVNSKKDEIKRCTKTKEGPCVDWRCGQWSRVPYSCNCGWSGSRWNRRYSCSTCYRNGHPCRRWYCARRSPEKVPYWNC